MLGVDGDDDFAACRLKDTGMMIRAVVACRSCEHVTVRQHHRSLRLNPGSSCGRSFDVLSDRGWRRPLVHLIAFNDMGCIQVHSAKFGIVSSAKWLA